MSEDEAGLRPIPTRAEAEAQARAEEAKAPEDAEKRVRELEEQLRGVGPEKA